MNKNRRYWTKNGDKMERKRIFAVGLMHLNRSFSQHLADYKKFENFINEIVNGSRKLRRIHSNLINIISKDSFSFQHKVSTSILFTKIPSHGFHTHIEVYLKLYLTKDYRFLFF